MPKQMPAGDADRQYRRGHSRPATALCQPHDPRPADRSCPQAEDHPPDVRVEDAAVVAARAGLPLAGQQPDLDLAPDGARDRGETPAPGRLCQGMIHAANRRGVTVHRLGSRLLGRTCSNPRCRHVADVDPCYGRSVHVVCPADGHVYDQDESAATMMLHRTITASGHTV